LGWDHKGQEKKKGSSTGRPSGVEGRTSDINVINISEKKGKGSEGKYQEPTG